MLWSLIKILLFVAAIAGIAYGSGLLMEAEGGLMITYADMEYTLGPFQAVLALVALVMACWVLFKLVSLLVAVLRFLNGDETAISRYFDRNREKKGYQALSDGLLALASGEGEKAIEKARKAERYLRKPELTNLLTAQAAEMAGDKRKATDVYKKLLKDDATRFVGVRGLLKQKLEEGNTETALKLAEKAFAIKPAHGETQDVLLQLQAEGGDWKGARETLGAKLRHGALPRDVHKRRDAVLALSEAKDILDEDASVEAREKAIEANRLSPDLIPAAVMAAQSYIEKGKARAASRLLQKAWEVQPHPDLAAAYASIAPDESAEARIKRFTKFTKHNVDHAEAKMLMAELQIAAENFPEARRALGDLYESEPTTRSLTIMAAIERGEGASDAVVKGWLARALTAPRGPQWVCDKCHNIHAEWTPVCGNCKAFDTLSWTAPPETDFKSATGVEMLPLIVGAIEDQSEEAPIEAEIVETEDAETESSVVGEDVVSETVEETSDEAPKVPPGYVK